MAKRFPDLEPKFDIEEAKNILGYPKTAPLDAEIKRLLNEARSSGRNLIDPKGLFDEVELEVRDHCVYIVKDKKRYEIKSKKLAQRLTNSSSAIVYAVTIGPAIEDKVQELVRKGEYTRALVYDAVGSAYAEGLADAAQSYLEGFFFPNELTPRYSPGYGDLDLEVQRVIFEILTPESIGLELTSSFMIKPRKSITAICGKILTSKK